MIRLEWMKGICHLWSRGRLISPSLPVGDDWYLNLSSQKRPTGRNLGGNRSVRRSGATSRGTALLPFYLRMRSFPRTEFLTICVEKSIRLGSTRNKAFGWVRFFNMPMRSCLEDLVLKILSWRSCLEDLVLKILSWRSDKFGLLTLQCN